MAASNGSRSHDPDRAISPSRHMLEPRSAAIEPRHVRSVKVTSLPKSYERSPVRSA
jgi:hypothetical protein